MTTKLHNVFHGGKMNKLIELSSCEEEIKFHTTHNIFI